MKDYSKPYVYKVVHKITRQFYVGSQCSGKIIGVNYFTSSHNLIFRNDFEKNTQNYEIYILAFFENKKECVVQENYQIRNSLWLHKELCLNRNYVDPDKHKRMFSMAGTTHTVSEETRRKLSFAQKGKPKPKLQGHVTTDETRRKIGLANSKHHPNEELKKRISNTLKEKYKNDVDFRNAHTERCKKIGKKISQTKKGVKQSQERKDLQSKVISKLWENEEYRKHMSEVHKGKKPSQETIEKRKIALKEAWARRKKVGLAEKHYYTNGINDVVATECPAGFWKGRTKGKRTK